MGIGEWTLQNWFNLLSAVGIVGSLLFTAISVRSDAQTKRVGNLLTITANHREVWNKYLINPGLKRVLNPAADPIKQPVNEVEEMFVNMVNHHINSVYYAMSDQLVIKYDELRIDVSEFISLPIPKTVWEKTKKYQNDDFVAFVESCRNLK